VDESPSSILFTHVLALVAGFGIAAFASMMLIFFWFLTGLVWRDREAHPLLKAWAWLPGAIQSLFSVGVVSWVFLSTTMTENVAPTLRLLFFGGMLVQVLLPLFSALGERKKQPPQSSHDSKG
jgi:hypothetical protein